jgi:hypothetical protein
MLQSLLRLSAIVAELDLRVTMSSETSAQSQDNDTAIISCGTPSSEDRRAREFPIGPNHLA